MKQSSNSLIPQGFTIIELMLSTVVFTLILMATTVALVQISRLYYRGVISGRTQETSRRTADEITQSIQFSGQQVSPPNYPSGLTTFGPNVTASERGADKDTFYFCIGPKRYTFAVDRKLSSTEASSATNKYKRHVLWMDIPASGCSGAVPAAGPAPLDDPIPTTGGRELLDENMRITRLELLPSTSGPHIWILNLSIAYGEEDFFAVTNNRKICEGSRIGVELCATAELSSTVQRRVQ